MPRILTSVRGEDLGYLQRGEEGRLYWQGQPIHMGRNYLPLIAVLAVAFGGSRSR
jgi:hypothetical protein